MLFANTKLLGYVVWFAWMANGYQSDGGDTEVNRTIDCIAARSACEGDINCAIAMYKVFAKEQCHKALGFNKAVDQITGPAAKICPRECAIAIHNLTSHSVGELFQDCECVNRDSICLTLKARMRRCMDTLDGPRNNTIRGCTEVRQECTNDITCDLAQKNFLKKCSRMISGVECSDECKLAIHNMLSVPHGQELDDCECDGYEEPHCRGIWAHYKALCFAQRPTSGLRRHSPTERTPYVGAGRNNSSKLHKALEVTCCIFAMITLYLHHLL